MLRAILNGMSTQGQNVIKRPKETGHKREAAHKEPQDRHTLSEKKRNRNKTEMRHEKCVKNRRLKKGQKKRDRPE